MPPLGLLGNIESLVPALAPIAGVGLLARFGWRVSFEVIALLSLVLPCWWWRCATGCSCATLR